MSFVTGSVKSKLNALDRVLTQSDLYHNNSINDIANGSVQIQGNTTTTYFRVGPSNATSFYISKANFGSTAVDYRVQIVATFMVRDNDGDIDNERVHCILYAAGTNYTQTIYVDRGSWGHVMLSGTLLITNTSSKQIRVNIRPLTNNFKTVIGLYANIKCFAVPLL